MELNVLSDSGVISVLASKKYSSKTVNHKIYLIGNRHPQPGAFASGIQWRLALNNFFDIKSWNQSLL